MHRKRFQVHWCSSFASFRGPLARALPCTHQGPLRPPDHRQNFWVQCLATPQTIYLNINKITWTRLNWRNRHKYIHHQTAKQEMKVKANMLHYETYNEMNIFVIGGSRTSLQVVQEKQGGTSLQICLLLRHYVLFCFVLFCYNQLQFMNI